MTEKYLNEQGLEYYHKKIKTAIPTKTSQLTNDSGFMTSGKLAGAILSETQPTDEAYALWVEEEDLSDSSSSSLAIDIIDVGAILPFAGENPPQYYLICNGAAVSRTTYSELFDVIGVKFGSGDGSTTFNLPDLRGKTLVGYNANDTDFNTIGKTGGEKTHTLTIAEMPSHNHDMYSPGYASSKNLTVSTQKNDPVERKNPMTSSTGGNQAHNNLQPYITLNYIIKYHREDLTVPSVASNSDGNVEIVDNLTSSSSTKALSAKQGKILNDTKISSSEVKDIKIVTSLPDDPVDGTLYLMIPE